MVTALGIAIVVLSIVVGLLTLIKTCLEGKVGLFMDQQTDKVLKSDEYKAWEKMMRQQKSQPKVKLRKKK